MEETKYDVFISYSRKDYVDEHNNVIPGNEVSIIKEALTEAGITFWMDEKGIVPGEDYAAKILKYIKACKIFVFISSAAANQSEWTRKEIACALAYKKEVIPLLLDDSPFHDSVMLRIVDLDRIDYYVNPEKGLMKLIRSVKTLLNEMEEKERRKKEEEEQRKEIERKKNEDAKRRKEEEERQRKEQQEQLVEDIRTSVKELNIEETKLDLERNKLLVKTEKVVDIVQRENLKTEITESSPIRKKSQTEIKRLQEQVAELKTECDSFEEKKKAFLKELADKNSENASLRKEVDSKRQEPIESKTSNNKWMHFVYGLVFGLILILIPAICVRSCVKHLPAPNHTNDSINLTQETVAVDSILEFLVDSVKFKMIKVEGGTFLMGAQKTDPNGPNFDKEAYEDESPVHEVIINSFYLGETEVTQALWRIVMGNNPSYYSGWDYPVECVSWDDICGKDGSRTDPSCFLYKLNQKTGKNFRLPTEAEWEYAARGGKKSNGFKYAGGNILEDVAWFWTNGEEHTQKIKGKRPNELGLYDMSGNVSEWCQDWKGYYSHLVQHNPTGSTSGWEHVIRGGAWCVGSNGNRVSYRGGSESEFKGRGLGFRLVLPEEISPEKP